MSISLYLLKSVGGTVASKSTLRSAETLLSRVRAPPPEQGDLRLLGPPSGHGASGEARTCDRSVPADLWAASLATVLQTSRLTEGLKD
ncbi:hypothetical protein PoB_006603800 [Plakobranchus ocellatus]|uniref:Uncharacterized protein n=1 Tax=Plakobranchus ocellatus TaxID=259542 RepID=A0AAV4D656_9GAST|nr:hypothetical protein PoB_006603800 [Plakobranchus ocellatus]